MSIRIKCGNCSKRLAAPDKTAGRTMKCPSCGASIQIPRAEAAAGAKNITDLLDRELAEQSATPSAAFNLADLDLAPVASLPAIPRPALPPSGSILQPLPPATVRQPRKSSIDFPGVLLRRKAPLLVLGFSILMFILFNEIQRPTLAMVVTAVGCAIGLGAWHSLALAEKRSPALGGWRSLENGIGTIVLIGLGVLYTLLAILDAINAHDAVVEKLGGGGIAGYYAQRFVGWSIFMAIGGAIYRSAEKDGFCKPAGWAYIPVTMLLWVILRYAPPPERKPELPTSQIAQEAVAEPPQATAIEQRASPAQPSPRPALRRIGSNVVGYDAHAGIAPGKPGHADQLYIYLPKGTHPKGSLGCVLIAAAGGTSLTGSSLGESSRPEHIPYAKAGFAVVAYETDGELDDKGTRSQEEISWAVRDFSAAEAGLVNARNALAYALAELPEIDAGRIYVAGHSSAATLALLIAETEPRIKACLAYAPVSDAEERNGEIMRSSEPGSAALQYLIKKNSPRTNEGKLNCPVFLFHAMDDSNVPAQQTLDFAARLRTLGKRVTLETVQTGNHYDSMIKEGIPKGVEWLCGLEGRKAPEKPAASRTAEAPSQSDAPKVSREPIRPNDGKPLPAPARRTLNDLSLEPGDRIEVQLGGKWEPAEFVERVSDRVIRVRRDSNPTPIPVFVDRVRIGEKRAD